MNLYEKVEELLCVKKYDIDSLKKILIGLKEYYSELEFKEPFNEGLHSIWIGKCSEILFSIGEFENIVDNYDSIETEKIYDALDSLQLYQIRFKGLKGIKLE